MASDNQASREPDKQSKSARKDKKSYQKPAFRHEKVFETLALACGKNCQHRRRLWVVTQGFLIASPMSASEGRLTHREALAAEALRHSGRLRMRVHGESMLPSLWPGDVAEIQTASLPEIGPGDIVLVFHEGRFFSTDF